MDDARLRELAAALLTVGGVTAVVLGGSRARGTHRPDSDYDLGLYYRTPFDLVALKELAERFGGAGAEVTGLGGWGPWVDGGGWLTIDGVRVDWIYRDLDRVRGVWADCRAGRYEVGFQPGHPLGFYSHAYAGELALCRMLAARTDEVPDLRAETRHYPAALADALVAGLWEADFMLRLGRYGVSLTDPTYLAGCLFRLVGVACQALHGRAGRWLINEKGMVAASAALPPAPDGFARSAGELLGSVGTTRAELSAAVTRAESFIAAVRAAVG